MSVQTIIRGAGSDGREATMELKGMTLTLSQYDARCGATTKCSITLDPEEALALMLHFDRQIEKGGRP